MKRWIRNGCLAWLVLPLLVPSCQVPKVTQADRTDSFRESEEVEIEGETLRSYLLNRTAMLVGGAELRSTDDVTRDSVSFRVRGKGDVQFGSAAAVDARGYFVTTAHCLQGKKTLVAFLTADGFEFEKARVVWSGDPDSSIADFALLHVDRVLDYTFEWATPGEKGDRVLAAGISPEKPSESEGDSKRQFRSDPLGGRVVKVSEGIEEDVRFVSVEHDSPLTEGNSGGPLVNEQGQLVAVNRAVALRFRYGWPTKRRRSFSVFPELDWLRDLIEADASKR